MHVFGLREEAKVLGESPYRHGKYAISTQKRPLLGFEPKTFLLWDDGANRPKCKSVYFNSDCSSEGVSRRDASTQQSYTETQAHSQQACYSHLELYEWKCHHNLPLMWVGVHFCVGTHGAIPTISGSGMGKKLAILHTRKRDRWRNWYFWLPGLCKATNGICW